MLTSSQRLLIKEINSSRITSSFNTFLWMNNSDINWDEIWSNLDTQSRDRNSSSNPHSTQLNQVLKQFNSIFPSICVFSCEPKNFPHLSFRTTMVEQYSKRGMSTKKYNICGHLRCQQQIFDVYQQYMCVLCEFLSVFSVHDVKWGWAWVLCCWNVKTYMRPREFFTLQTTQTATAAEALTHFHSSEVGIHILAFYNWNFLCCPLK